MLDLTFNRTFEEFSFCWKALYVSSKRLIYVFEQFQALVDNFQTSFYSLNQASHSNSLCIPMRIKGTLLNIASL